MPYNEILATVKKFEADGPERPVSMNLSQANFSRLMHDLNGEFESDQRYRNPSRSHQLFDSHIA